MGSTPGAGGALTVEAGSGLPSRPGRCRSASSLVWICLLVPAPLAGTGQDCANLRISFPSGESPVPAVELDGCDVIDARTVPDPLRSGRRAVELHLETGSASRLLAKFHRVLEEAASEGRTGWNTTLEVRAGNESRRANLFVGWPELTALAPAPVWLVGTAYPRLHVGGLTPEEARVWVDAAGPDAMSEPSSGGRGDTVRVSGGLIAGISGDDATVREFRGIPYAEPPVGDLRWRTPHRPEPWSGVRDADRFAPACMQVPPPEGSFYQREFYEQAEPVSEDCLYLNVWTAAGREKERRPVMVWIHGGGFAQGSGSMPSFDGEALARRGGVVVTFNYRLGVFGLLAHPELSREGPAGSSGNYGLLDHVAALEWVRENIAAFGGNPANVTIFGQSSGADNVNILLASPLAGGLFHRAILQSGSTFAFGRKPSLAEAERGGAPFADSAAGGSIAVLRALDADAVLERSGGFGFLPNVDGWLLPEPADRVLARGRQHDVPVLAGSTADEGTTLFGEALDAERFRDLVERQFGEDAAAFLEVYPAASDEQARRSFNDSFTDEIAWAAEALAERHMASASSRAWLYRFTRVPPGRRPERYGAFHSSEIVYVFGTLDSVDRPWTPEDRALSGLLMDYWTRFARTGDPNGPGLPTWPAYDRERRLVLELELDPAPRTVLGDAERRFLERRWTSR